MLTKLIRLLKDPTSLNVYVNTLGSYLNIFFAVLVFLILTRVFTREEMGVYGVLFGIAYVLANILDFGTTATIYSYFPTLYEKRGDNMYNFIKSTFYYQSLFSSCIILILFITFPWLDRTFFKTGAPTLVLYLTAISVLFFIWQNFAMNILIASKKFIKANLYLNIANVIKTLIVLAVIYKGKITVGNVIFIFGIIGPLIFFALLLIQKKDLLSILMKSKIKREAFHFGYTLPYFIASQFYNLGTRMDIFLLSYFGLRAETGDYTIGQKIILTIIATVVSITQVLSPLFANAKTKQEIKRHFKTGIFYMLLPTGIFLVLYFVPPWVYSLSFTERFVKAAPLTSALAIAFILNPITSIPMLFLLYTVKRPGYIVVTNILFFLIITLGCWRYIPTMGVMAAPYAIFIAFAVSALILTGGTIYEYRKLKA